MCCGLSLAVVSALYFLEVQHAHIRFVWDFWWLEWEPGNNYSVFGNKLPQHVRTWYPLVFIKSMRYVLSCFHVICNILSNSSCRWIRRKAWSINSGQKLQSKVAASTTFDFSLLPMLSCNDGKLTPRFVIIFFSQPLLCQFSLETTFSLHGQYSCLTSSASWVPREKRLRFELKNSVLMMSRIIRFVWDFWRLGWELRNDSVFVVRTCYPLVFMLFVTFCQTRVN